MRYNFYFGLKMNKYSMYTTDSIMSSPRVVEAVGTVTTNTTNRNFLTYFIAAIDNLQ